MHRAAAATPFGLYLAAIRGRIDRQLARVAWLLGTVLRLARLALPYVPGVAGVALVAFGLGLIYTPLAFLAGGVALILIDRRIR